jgi:hypothetical protein
MEIPDTTHTCIYGYTWYCPHLYLWKYLILPISYPLSVRISDTGHILLYIYVTDTVNNLSM